MSETPAIYQVGRGVPAEPHTRPRPAPMDAEPLVSTIRWTPLDERLPAYGQTVVVWIGLLGITVRAYRDARCEGVWRGAGTDAPLDDAMVTAWTDAPTGPLPPPDGGGA